MNRSARRNRRRQKRATISSARSRPTPIVGRAASPVQNDPGQAACVACPNGCVPSKWIPTEQRIRGEWHQVYFEVHKEVPVDLTCKIVEAVKYHGHPLVSYRFMKSIRASMYDQPEVRSVLENGDMIASRRMIRTIFRDRKRFYRMELMVVPEDLEIYCLNGWIGDDGRIPDIVLNSKWRRLQ